VDVVLKKATSERLAAYKLYAITPAGQVKWTVTAGGVVYSSPAIAADGTVYAANVGSGSGCSEDRQCHIITGTTRGDIAPDIPTHWTHHTQALDPRLPRTNKSVP
jgi:hypothetical protein